MLKPVEIKKIQELLENSQNPLFLFDDDQDGLCSYIVLKRKYNKGAGIAIKTTPELDNSYTNVVNEYSPDLIIILDKPLVSEEFFKNIHAPVLWIDHHPIVNIKKYHHEIHYFNTLANDPNTYTPTTYLAYQVTEEKSWFVLLGCIGDYFLPEFYREYIEKYPDLLREVKDPGEITYNTKFGEVVKSTLFLLKGKAGDIKKHVSALEKIESPYEILNKTSTEGKFLAKEAEKARKEYDELLKEAIKEAEENSDSKLILFIYPSSKNSYTAELSNELFYKFKDKFIIVGREKNDEVKMSLRCNFANVPKVIEKALIGIHGYGGGHEKASGGCVKRDDFDRFIENIKEQIE